MRALLAIGSLALVLTACGGGGKSAKEDENPLSTAAAETAKQVSERTTVNGKVSLAGRTLMLRGEGGFDQRKQEGWLHLDVSARGGGSSTVDEVFIKTIFWMKSPLFASALPEGKEWLKVDLQRAGVLQGFNFKALLGQTPADALQQLRRTVADVETLGTEKVGGVETTHYRAAVDPTKAPASAKTQRITGAVYKPLDVWVDGEDLVRQVRLDYTANATEAPNGKAHTVLTMRLSGFGDPVDVEPPAPNLVVDASARVGSG